LNEKTEYACIFRDVNSEIFTRSDQTTAFYN